MRRPANELFQQQWPTRSPNRQLVSLLAALVQKLGGSMDLPIEDILAIEPGETVTLDLGADKVTLRYSPHSTIMYTIQDTGTPWRNETPASTSAVLTDTALADLEEAATRRANLQREAQSMRTEPLTGADRLRRTARSSPQ